MLGASSFFQEAGGLEEGLVALWTVRGEIAWDPESVTPQPALSLHRMPLRLEPGLATAAAAPLTPPTNALRGSRCSRLHR